MGESRSVRRTKVAEGLAAGKTVTAIAAEQGISRATASRDANHPETRQILAGYCAAHSDKLESLFHKSLRVLDEAMDAKGVHLTKEGNAIVLGPDHYARMTAVLRFVKILTAGRPTPKAEDTTKDDRRISWAEVQEMLRDALPN